MTESATIVASAVRYRYGAQVALAGVDLSFGPGVLGLLGPNGAGKTTLLHLLATVARPQEGSLRLLGLDPAALADRRQIRRWLGYLPQTVGHLPDFTAAEFVESFALLKGVPVREVRRTVGRALERVGLNNQARRKLRALSGGQLRRAAIAQAIVTEPALLLLDEPTVGLDPGQRVAFRELLRELGERSTVVVSTHLVEDVAAACGEVIVLANGRVVFAGTASTLIERGAEGGPGDSQIERGYSSVLGASGWAQGA